ncbi:hypothetical protein TNIN_238601 [Trichonephila inaurata madagascariensis]|uniref:GATA-type domain-containing protein n=1 Tax=Trichonephila inaurata madagascariensis TaxID=2747483 RepID=A0A8X7C872_9ARAC|nr:hypothetical protein TNIN_238601 [Trichonephila inaurata madagascariensis]
MERVSFIEVWMQSFCTLYNLDKESGHEILESIQISSDLMESEETSTVSFLKWNKDETYRELISNEMSGCNEFSNKTAKKDIFNPEESTVPIKRATKKKREETAREETKICSNCRTQSTTNWRWNKGERLCNACGLYLKEKGVS